MAEFCLTSMYRICRAQKKKLVIKYGNMVTVNWKIFELKLFHKKKYYAKKNFVVLGGLGKFLSQQKGDVI